MGQKHQKASTLLFVKTYSEGLLSVLGILLSNVPSPKTTWERRCFISTTHVIKMFHQFKAILHNFDSPHLPTIPA